MTRIRLSPEARREQLLDVAKAAIIKDGLQQLSLKQLAADASVSEPLLFHYFSSRVDLLQQLLTREYNRYLDALEQSLEGARSMHDILHAYVSRNFDHHTEDSAIDILLAEPDICIAVEERRTAHLKEREKFLVGTIANELGVNRRKAAMFALMASAASIAAAGFAHEAKLGRDEAIDSVIHFIIEGFESAKAPLHS
jgi:AcrR family transcriptional regulator